MYAKIYTCSPTARQSNGLTGNMNMMWVGFLIIFFQINGMNITMQFVQDVRVFSFPFFSMLCKSVGLSSSRTIDMHPI